MRTNFLTFLKSFWDRRALEAVYQVRQALRPSEENRTTSALFVTTALLVLVLGFLLYMASARQDIDDHLKSRPNIAWIKSDRVSWQATGVLQKDCADAVSCRQSLISRAELEPTNLSDYVLRVPDEIQQGEFGLALFRTSVKKSDWSGLNLQQSLVLTLPKFGYHRAHLFIDGISRTDFLDSGWIYWQFRDEDVTADTVDVEVLFEISHDQEHLPLQIKPDLNLAERHLAVMTVGEQRTYLDQLALSRAGRGNVIGSIARVAMAVFVLALFLLIDGSPETLGLGLFLGFEAAAITMGYDWLPLSNNDFLKHYCYQMGDIFRLYFFLQIARIADKKVGPWLFWGTLVSVPYGLLRHYGPELAIVWPSKIPNYRDIIAGGVGMLVCLRAAWYLRDKKLPWRVTALIIAAVAAFEQVADPVGMFFPGIYNGSFFQKFVDIIHPFSAWLFAFSAFINISTLENRVKTLGSLEARTKEMEKEMELGRAVQQAFMNLPKFPDELHFACHHEAMLYVSGDTYFVDWNERHKTLTFLVNDVTGHGVQAALKASGVSVIASTVWGDRNDPEWRNGKLEQYADLVEDFLAKMNTEPDVLAMGGCEFDLATGMIEILRINFPFPVVIEPKVDLAADNESRKSDNWRVRILPTNSRELTRFQLMPGAIVVLTSDGFLDNSRRTTDFLRYMRKNLATRGDDLSTETVKAYVLDCPHLAETKDSDDRTMTVFQWRPEAMPRFGESSGRGAA